MEPVKYARMSTPQIPNSHEDSAPLLDLEQQPNLPRMSEETFSTMTDPMVDDPMTSDGGSSKESRHDNEQTTLRNFRQAYLPSRQFEVNQDRLPRPVVDLGQVSPPRFRAGPFKHFALLLPRIMASMVWFVLFLSWMGLCICYLVSWLFLQASTGFVKVEFEKGMVRRDLGGFFDRLMDAFESIW